MPPTSRALLVAGSVLLVALGPVAVPDESNTDPAGAAVVAAGDAPPTAPSATGGPLQRMLDASRGAPVPRRRPKPHREPRGDTGPCRSGLVVLTFDDGPDPALTPRLVRILTDLQVPATFFMVGHRVASAPAAARTVGDAGLTVANHTFGHELMTRQSVPAIRTTLRRTDRRLRSTGLRPSKLMRPPYGAMDQRVRKAIASVGLVPVLWDVDPRDWEQRSSGNIAQGVLSRLRPGRSNVVLQHDGIRNSANSIAAVPQIVRVARRRGYCFGDLDSSGRPFLPTPRVTARAAPVREGRRMALDLRLNAPTNRTTSVLVTTADASAQAGRDYRPREVRVEFPAGRSRARVTTRVRRDRVDERNERFTFALSGERGLTVGTPQVIARILDTTPAPRVRVIGSRTIAAPDATTARAQLSVRLSRPSERRVIVRLRGRRGQDGPVVRRTVRIRPGQREAVFGVVVPLDPDGGTVRAPFRIVGATNAQPRGPRAVAVVDPAPDSAEPVG